MPASRAASTYGADVVRGHLGRVVAAGRRRRRTRPTRSPRTTGTTVCSVNAWYSAANAVTRVDRRRDVLLARASRAPPWSGCRRARRAGGTGRAPVRRRGARRRSSATSTRYASCSGVPNAGAEPDHERGLVGGECRDHGAVRTRVRRGQLVHGRAGRGDRRAGRGGFGARDASAANDDGLGRDRGWDLVRRQVTDRARLHPAQPRPRSRRAAPRRGRRAERRR